MNQFWILWNENFTSMGSGTPGQDEMFRLDTSQQKKFSSFAILLKSGSGVTADWQFSSSTGRK